MTFNKQDFVQAARAFKETPFKHQARLPGVGLDCAGVVICALRAINVPVTDYPGYAKTPHQGLLIQAVQSQCAKIPVDDLQNGDIIVFRFLGNPQHLAIYADNNIIHSWEAVGKCVEHVLDDKWRSRIVGCYRIIK